MRRVGVYIFLFLIFALGFWRLGHRGELKLFENSRILMDTLVTISLYDRDETHSQQVMEAGFQKIARVDEVMNAYKKGSEVWEVNQASGDSFVPVGKGLFGLLSRSLRFSRLTKGAFDPTVGPLENLWGFTKDKYRVPKEEEIEMLLPLVGYKRVRLDGLHQRIFLPLKGTKIDLGGVAKGYAADKAAEVMEEMGIPGGIVNAGGDIRLWGKKPRGGLWRVAIRHPRQQGEFIGYLHLPSQGVATSGDYERCFFQMGKRYHHILDPTTGYPADSAVSVTVIAPSAEQADILATGAFVLGPKRGRELLEALPGVEGIIFYKREGTIKSYLTSGMRKRYNPEKGLTLSIDEKEEERCASSKQTLFFGE